MSAPRPADRGREPAALRRGLEFGHCLPLRRKAGGKELPVPVAGYDLPAIARQFVREVLRIANAEQLGARVVTQAPGRKADRGQMRLQVARRHVDDQPADPAVEHRGQFRRDDLDMPAKRECSPRVELGKRALREAHEIALQQPVIAGPGHQLVH